MSLAFKWLLSENNVLDFVGFILQMTIFFDAFVLIFILKVSMRNVTFIIYIV